MVNAVGEKKEAAWKEKLGAKDEFAKERCMEAYKEEKRMLKGVYFRIKRKKNQD